MALGGAVVAYPTDPTTVYWNPAGLEVLSRKSLSVFYASFLEGTSYQYVGFAYPTLYIGSFGIGVARIATGGIIRRDQTFQNLGEFGYDQSEIFFSYAKTVWNQWIVGGSFKLERQSIDRYSDIGFGVDVGVLYTFLSDNVFLENLRVGAIVQNAYSPRLNTGETTDYVPHRIRVGIAKPLYFGDGSMPLVLLFGLNKGDQEDLRISAGLEFSYQNMGMLRMGFNEDGLMFGAGAQFRHLQLDYAYARLADGELGASHRFSLTFEFGPTREELLAEEEARLRREIERRVAMEQERERRAQVNRLLNEGKQFYANGNYFEALIRFSQALELDKGNPEAERMLQETNARIQEQRQKELEAQLKQIQEEQRRQEIESNVKLHVDRGLQFLNEQKYHEAIREFNRALEYQPNSQTILDLIARANKEIKRRIDELIRQADEAAKRKDYNEAIRLLNRAQLLAQTDTARKDKILQRIAELEKKLNVLDYYRQGLFAYREKRWEEAMNFLKKALQLSPNDPDIQHYYQEARRRALAREEPLPPELEVRFNQALKLYLEDKLEEAIRILQELERLRPYNKTILETLDRIRGDLEKKKRMQNNGK
jgi:tetratricopeptide (TPR) repeat protein